MPIPIPATTGNETPVSGIGGFVGAVVAPAVVDVAVAVVLMVDVEVAVAFAVDVPFDVAVAVAFEVEVAVAVAFDVAVAVGPVPDPPVTVTLAPVLLTTTLTPSCVAAADVSGPNANWYCPLPEVETIFPVMVRILTLPFIAVVLSKLSTA